jgi:hypothetical protein
VNRLPSILSSLLLLAGAVAWLLGPGAPAQPRGAARAAEEAAQEPWSAEVWLEGEVEDPEAPARPAPEAPEPRSLEAERSRPAAVDASRGPAPAQPDCDASLELVRRMLALHARMGEE